MRIFSRDKTRAPAPQVEQEPTGNSLVSYTAPNLPEPVVVRLVRVQSATCTCDGTGEDGCLEAAPREAHNMLTEGKGGVKITYDSR